MTTIDQPRVFWPGDELPMGAWVMGSDEKPWQVWCPGATVNVDEGTPLVEVPVPDYRSVVRTAGQRFVRVQSAPADLPEVAAGQVWAPVAPWASRVVRVAKVDKALVWTDQGRHTVFSLMRHYRLVSS